MKVIVVNSWVHKVTGMVFELFLAVMTVWLRGCVRI